MEENKNQNNIELDSDTLATDTVNYFKDLEIIEDIKKDDDNIKKYIDKDKGIFPSEFVQLEIVKDFPTIIYVLVKFGDNEILHPSEKIQYIAYKCSEEYFDRTILYVYLQEDLIPKFEELYKKGVKSL